MTNYICFLCLFVQSCACVSISVKSIHGQHHLRFRIQFVPNEISLTFTVKKSKHWFCSIRSKTESQYTPAASTPFLSLSPLSRSLEVFWVDKKVNLWLFENLVCKCVCEPTLYSLPLCPLRHDETGMKQTWARDYSEMRHSRLIKSSRVFFFMQFNVNVYCSIVFASLCS